MVPGRARSPTRTASLSHAKRFAAEAYGPLSVAKPNSKASHVPGGPPRAISNCRLSFSQCRACEAVGLREQAALASSDACGTHFLAARLISPLFFPPVRPISAGERFRAFAAFRSALRRLLRRPAKRPHWPLAARRSKSACASRSTSGHFIVTLRYVVQSLPMTMRDFLQSTLPPSLKGISTGSLSPGRTP